MSRLESVLLSIIESARKHRTAIIAMCAMVVFITTYVLILPAFTLDAEKAAKQGGIDLPAAATSIEDADTPAADADLGETDSADEGTEDADETSDEKALSGDDNEKKGSDALDAEDKADDTATKNGKSGTSDGEETAGTGDALAGPLTFEGEGFSVAVNDESKSLPKNTELKVDEVVEKPADATPAETKEAKKTYKKYYDKALEAVNEDASAPKKEISFVKFYDISLQSAGEEIQPDSAVNVTISYDEKLKKELKVDNTKDVKIIHFAEDKATGTIETEILEDTAVDVTLEKSRMAETTFEAESFSVYAVVYTVDFEFVSEVDGKTYEYSIEGGGSIGLRELLPVLGVVEDDKTTGTNEVDSFIEQIDEVRFSNPTLINISKTERDTTIGAIKTENGLECVYSEDLTREQIEDINSKAVKAGDWVLISLKEFDTEETLLISMQDGTNYTIVVTDAQINADDYENVIYTYTVNDTNAGTINLVNSSGNPSGQNNTGTTVTDGLNNAKDKANRFARAVPNNGYRFVRWTNDGNDYKNGANDIRPSKAELENGEYTSDTFVANFVANNDYLISLQTTEGGRIKDDLTSLTYNQIINTAPDIFAIPDPGYRCLGWRDQYGQMVTTDRYLYSSNIAHADGIYTAVFEKILDQNIYYKANGTYGTVSNEHEIVHGDDLPVGSVATPKDGYQFISWVNDLGETVWPLEEFYPFADLIYDGATYTAVFESASYSSYFMMQADDTSHGHIDSPQYENSVNGRIVSMYIRDDGTIPAQLKAVANEGWLFDHWEVNGVEIDEMGDTIPAGYDFSGFELRDGWNVLIAYYKENPVVLTHTITYVANTGGTVRGTANTQIGGHYVDQWQGTNSSTVKGATATANTNWTFTGWLEKLGDGTYRVVSNDSNFVPSGELLKDTTYYAAFRRNESQKGMVGYNMNVTDMPIKWTGVQDIVIASGAGAPMYYDTNNGNYFARGQKFYMDTTIPEAEGYYFLGWYNKDRNKWLSTNSNNDNGNCPVNQGGHPATTGDIIPRGSDTTLDGLSLTGRVFPMGGTGSRYTFEAMFAGIKADSKRLPYDGTSHQLIGTAELFKGTVGETERFRAQLETLKNNGGYRLDPVKYQLLDENGNPVGEATDSFERTLPGTYKVRVYADGEFAGEDFTLYKDITLEIYSAKVIIKKYWLNDHYSVRPDDLDVDVYKYDTKNKGAVNNPDTNINNRNQAKQNSENVTARAENTGTNVASILSGYNKEEPEWQKHGSVWTIEYDDVLVRNVGYSETDQASGYDLFFADETVPDGYNQVWTNWARSEDKLTTTISFRNEYLAEPLSFDATKEWIGDKVQAKHPSVTFYLLRSINGAPFEKLEESEKVIPANATGSALTVHWNDIPQKNNSGTEHYTYKIAEMTLDGFTTEITGSVTDGYVVKNTDTRIDIPVIKVDKGDESVALADAEFTLSKLKDGRYQPYIASIFTESPYADAAACVFKSDNDGKLTIEGLSDGDYQLEETDAPDGYIRNGEMIQFTVEDGYVSLSDGAGIVTYEKYNPSDSEKSLVIRNESGAELPHTGGIGTTLFYILGSVLAIGCGIMLVARRRIRKSA